MDNEGVVRDMSGVPIWKTSKPYGPFFICGSSTQKWVYGCD